MRRHGKHTHPKYIYICIYIASESVYLRFVVASVAVTSNRGVTAAAVAGAVVAVAVVAASNLYVARPLLGHHGHAANGW